MSRRDIRGVWVGPLPAQNEPIPIVEYDPAWPRLFVREEKRIRSVLADRVLGLEHVGPTALPGLPAKPRIDIDLTVADSGDEGARALMARIAPEAPLLD